MAKASPDSWGFSVTTNLKDTGAWLLPQGRGQSSDDTTAPCWYALASCVDGISAPCSDEFIIGLHLSPERFGIRLDEVIPLTQQFIDRGHLDFLDMSLWDCFKMIDDPACQYRSLISAFTELDRKDVLLTVAGKIYQPPDAVKCMQAGADFVTLGRVAIVHYDYPQ